MQERDDAAKRVVLGAKGQEQKGKGAANATVTSWLEQGDGVTNVKMQADIHAHRYGGPTHPAAPARGVPQAHAAVRRLPAPTIEAA